MPHGCPRAEARAAKTHQQHQAMWSEHGVTPGPPLLRQRCEIGVLPTSSHFPKLKEESLGWKTVHLFWLGQRAAIKASPLPAIHFLFQALPKINS